MQSLNIICNHLNWWIEYFYLSARIYTIYGENFVVNKLNKEIFAYVHKHYTKYKITMIKLCCLKNIKSKIKKLKLKDNAVDIPLYDSVLILLYILSFCYDVM